MAVSMRRTVVKSSPDRGEAEESEGRTGFCYWLGRVLGDAAVEYEPEDSTRPASEVWTSYLFGNGWKALLVVAALAFGGWWAAGAIRDVIHDSDSDQAPPTRVSAASPDEVSRVAPRVAYKHTLLPGRAADRYVDDDGHLVFVVADDGDNLRLDEYASAASIVTRLIGSGTAIGGDDNKGTLDQMFGGNFGTGDTVESLHVESRIVVSTIVMVRDREDVYVKNGKKRLAIRDGHARIFDEKGSELPHVVDASG